MTKKGSTPQFRYSRKLSHSLSVAVTAALFGLAVPGAGLYAQDDAADAEQAGVLEEVVVIGARAIIQNSIAEKRDSDIIVEALSVDDIGDIPALSIGEALETLTSAASHREQGGATEISIRGMGPFLGSTVINGREASNGSGDRSVNFSQFPSELFNKIEVYKTQSASMIEGGVSGQISLETLKPLDLGKQRFQIDLKANYNPDNADIENNNNEIGYRGTLSYVDQWETAGGGEIGLALGYQTNQGSNPEAEANSSSGWRDCRNDPNESSGVYSSGNCDSGGGDLVMEIDPETGTAPDANTPFIMVPSQRYFRQNTTDDDRESFFGALQFRPNDDWEVNLDVELSDRTFTEIRNDLVFAEQRRINPEGLVIEAGRVQEFYNNGRIETLSTAAERNEEYKGGGLNLIWQATDRLQLSGDLSYSNTERTEFIVHTRLQSESTDIFGNPTPAGTDRPEAFYLIEGGPAEFPVVTLENFDVTNHDLFADNARTRIDRNQDRSNTITSGRLDFNLEMGGFITDIDGGIRYSELDFVSYPRIRDQRTFSDDALTEANVACRTDFPESGFLSEPANGANLVTNVDENGNVIDSGTGNTYASFDPICLVNEFTGGDWAFPEAGPSVQNVDVTENTIAAYLQANYLGELFGKSIRGNFGLRGVQTEVKSVGLRTTLSTVQNPDGTISVIEDSDNFTSVSGGNDYTEWLPSVNMVMDLNENLLLRGAIFRGLSRPDPSDMGYGRSFSVDDDDATSVEDLVSTATASGNPFLEPLTSWNYDVALEWYPNEDTIVAAGFYYKDFIGGFENIQQIESVVIDGQDTPATVTTVQTSDETNTLYGFELSVAHSLSYLDNALSGLGFKAGFNWADSDFEFEDSTFGAATVVDPEGNVVSARLGLIPPANLFGFSEQVFSGQVYYGIGNWDFAVLYKYRSEYFQQFISSPGVIRYIEDNSVWEARIAWQVTDNINIRLEGLNLFDEPKRQSIPILGNRKELNSYGPRLFLGVRAKF